MQSWTIGFLCYNEEESIIKVLEHAFNITPRLTSDFEIMVINDGSYDGSLSIITKYKQEVQPSLIIINHETNKGIGEALISGYKNATKENVLITCGDGQFDISELIPFKEFEDNIVVCFYRVNNTTYSLKRNYLSALNKYLNRSLLGLNLKDINWAKVYKLSELKKIEFEVKSSLVETEICAKLKILGNRFVEIESRYIDRIGGVSKGASPKIVLMAVRDIFSLFLKITYFRVVNKLIVK